MVFNDIISFYDTSNKTILYKDIFVNITYLKSIRFEARGKKNFSEILSENFILISMHLLPKIHSKLSVIWKESIYSIAKLIEYRNSIEIYAVHST